MKKHIYITMLVLLHAGMQGMESLSSSSSSSSASSSTSTKSPAFIIDFYCGVTKSCTIINGRWYKAENDGDFGTTGKWHPYPVDQRINDSTTKKFEVHAKPELQAHALLSSFLGIEKTSMEELS